MGLKYDTPLHFAGVRFVFAGLMILPFTVKPSLFVRMIIDNKTTVGLVTLLQTIINYSLFYIGLDLVPGAVGAVLVGSQPLITAIVASMMQKEDTLTRKKIITIIFGLGGVVLISAGRHAFRFSAPSELFGVLLILCANISVATSNVIVSVKSKGMNPLVLSSSTLFMGGVVLYVISLFSEKAPPGKMPSEYWFLLLWLSIMGASAFSLWFKLLQRPGVKVSELNLWKFIIPVVGAVVSWVVVPGEKPEWVTITGMIIIIGSLVLFYRKEKVVNPG